jgi:hypothetical protein
LNNEIELLLVLAAQCVSGLLANDGEYGLVVHQSVIEARDQMRRAGAGRRNTDTKTSGEFGIGGCHESRHFFMARLNEFDPVMRPVERAEDTVDAVTRVSEDVANIPLLQALNEEVADCLGHGNSSGIATG